MANLLTLDIVTPEKLVLREEVNEVSVPGIQGEFGILPEHSPFISTLGIGTLTLRRENKTRKFLINGGFAEVSADHVIILTETCEAEEQIDLDRARKSLQESSQKVLDLDANDPSYQAIWARAKRAQARVELGEHYRKQ